MTLSDDLVLQRAPDIALQLDAQQRVRLAGASDALDFGPHALAILHAFHRAQPLGDAIDNLQRRLDDADVTDLRDTIARLHAAGALRDAHSAPLRLRAINDGYDSAPIHVAMLNDRTRVSRFLAGIREVVRPGDVVLDLGTGVGIFAIAAALAGARHVYAVEANAIGQLAQAAFAANGLADRITLVQGWSSQITLPDRCDVLISEMVGNEPTADYMMEVMMDARKRLLKPNARMVPGRVRIYGLPLAIPEDERARYTFTEPAARRWSERYAMDLTPLAAPTRRSDDADGSYILVRPYSARAWTTFSEPVLLANIDMIDVHQLQINTAASVMSTTTGAINGLMVFFETQLGPSTSLSIAPNQAEHDSFRYTPVWMLDTPVEVRAGQSFRLEYRYRVQGARGGVSLASSDDMGVDVEPTPAMIGEFA